MCNYEALQGKRRPAYENITCHCDLVQQSKAALSVSSRKREVNNLKSLESTESSICFICQEVCKSSANLKRHIRVHKYRFLLLNTHLLSATRETIVIMYVCVYLFAYLFECICVYMREENVHVGGCVLCMCVCTCVSVHVYTLVVLERVNYVFTKI